MIKITNFKQKKNVSVVRKENESTESLIERFNRGVRQNGHMAIVRDKMYHRSKAEKRRDKRERNK